MKKLLLVLLSCGVLLSLWRANSASPSKQSSTRSARKVVANLRDVRTVYVRRVRGDQVFTQRLLREFVPREFAL
jgi:hypothetical protein